MAVEDPDLDPPRSRQAIPRTRKLLLLPYVFFPCEPPPGTNGEATRRQIMLEIFLGGRPSWRRIISGPTSRQSHLSRSPPVPCAAPGPAPGWRWGGWSLRRVARALADRRFQAVRRFLWRGGSRPRTP